MTALAGCKLQKPAPEQPIKTILSEFQIIRVARRCNFTVMDVKNKLVFQNLSIGHLVDNADECQLLMGRKFQSSLNFYQTRDPSLPEDEARISLMQIIMENRQNAANSTVTCTSKPVKNPASK